MNAERAALASAQDLNNIAGGNSNNTIEVQSNVDSYKRRSNSYFRNPLMPPKELLVSVPDRDKPAAYRTPFYR